MQDMLLRKQKQNKLIGIDLNTIVPKEIFEKLLKKEKLNKEEKNILSEKMKYFSNSIRNINKDYNSIYIFSGADYGKYNKYQKTVVSRILKNLDIDYRRIVVCPNELVEAVREFRIDILVLDKDKHYVDEKEKMLDITLSNSKRNFESRKLKNRNNLNNYDDYFKYKAIVDYIPEYTQLIFIEKTNINNSDKVQFIDNYYGLSNAIDNAKENIRKRKEEIFKSYEYIPKTGNPTFDREDKKYWLSSKFENNVYDNELQKMSRFEFVMFHNRFNMDDIMYIYEPFNAAYTYNDIKQMVLSAISYFKNTLGLKKGDSVSICLPNSIQDVVAQFALNHIGVIINAIHPLSSLNKIESFMESTNPKYFIYMDMPKSDDQKDPISLDYLIDKYNLNGVINVSLVEDANQVIKMAFALKTKKQSPESKRYTIDDKSKVILWKDIIKDRKNDNLITPSCLNPNDISYYYSTGGTSAKSSKTVKLPHFFDNISYYNSYGINMEKGDVAFSNYPSYIAFSDGNCRHQPACVGLLTIISPKDYPDNFAKKLESTKATVLQVAPQFFRLMLDAELRGEFDGVDLSHFKYVVAGGDKASNELKEDVLAFFSRHNNNNVHFFVGCGCTELGGSTIVQLFELGNTLDEKSIGIPLPPFNINIKSDMGESLNNNEKTGELYIGIDGIDNIGYANADELTNKVFKKENGGFWYNTEDVIEFPDDNSGVMDFVSRNKRFIMITKDNTSGKVVPDDVELQIMGNVKEVEIVSVVGIEENNETKLKAAVKLRPGVIVTDTLIENIKSAACKKDVLAKLDEIVFVDSMPLTDRQKVKYIEIEDMFKNKNDSKKLILK